MKIKLLISVSIVLFLISWNKVLPPYSIFKECNYEIIKQSDILVNLNSSCSVFIQTGYELSYPIYLLQKIIVDLIIFLIQALYQKKFMVGMDKNN